MTCFCLIGESMKPMCTVFICLFDNRHELLKSYCWLYVGPSEIRPINLPRKPGSNLWGMLHETDTHHTPSDASLFSSSLPVLPHEKCMFLFSLSTR